MEEGQGLNLAAELQTDILKYVLTISLPLIRVYDAMAKGNKQAKTALCCFFKHIKIMT